VDDSLVADAGAAFSIERDGAEQLVVVQELDKRDGADAGALLQRIPEAIRAEHDVTPFAVVLIKRGSMLKTSSGKVQRRAMREAYLRGQLQVTASWQVETGEPPVQQPVQDAAASSSDSEPASRTRLRPVAASRRERVIIDWLRARIAEKLKRDPLEIDAHEPLARYGIDSLAAAELTEALEQWLGRELPSTISYDNPTIASLARALAQSGREPTQRTQRSKPEPATSSSVAQDDPIAIVGMACRFPGAPDLKAFWNLLRHGVDAIEEVPPERWDADALYDPKPGVPGKMCSKWGGFVEGIDQFDAAFFGISAHEAARMDPQQRMFLELAWAALEDAGQAPLALAGTRTGVFAGVCSNDYATLYARDLDLIDADYGTGNAPSIVANRLSYVLDLKGPSETIDSACSSSLVALAHALSNLRARDCDTAIVGGVNAVLAPESSIYFSHARMLAQDGRCKAFDSRADGFVRSEGGGVVVLKRLSQAIADGDRVYALVAGGAVNHDGRSNGLLAPNGLAQQDVIERALSSAGITAADLDYVEAHGVGSPVADAVELRALGAVLGDRSPLQPLLVGSAKTNVGHLEAASGMVSLIKVALALHHEEIPAHLHLRDPHPDIDLEALPIEVPTLAIAWKRGERPRFAGTSAFGFGGANAHVVLREAPLQARAESALDRPRHVIALSAKSDAALRQLAARLAHRLGNARGESLGDITFSANAGRSHFTHRLAVVAPHVTELRDRLEHFAHGARDLRVHTAQRKPGARMLAAFVFGDAGATPGLGRALYERHPQFKQALDLCDRLLQGDLERPLLDVLHGGDAESSRWLTRPSYAHAACISLQYALHSLVRAWGIEPVAVYGAGAGEYAAAAASGVLPWEQAIKLAAHRGLVHEGLTPNAVQRCTVRQLKQELAAVDWLAPSVPFVSAALGRAFTLDEVPDEAHFAQQLYRAPKPSDGRVALLAEGCETYLEIGPVSTFDARAHVAPGTWLPTLGDDDWQTLLDAVAALYVAGADIDWRAFDAPYGHHKLSLPAYPFERERHWLEFRERSATTAEASVTLERASSHPLISRVRIRSSVPSGAVPRLQSDVVPGGDDLHEREHDAGA
jgi:acyl transferase domain-containing protein/acyl carrier protein